MRVAVAVSSRVKGEGQLEMQLEMYVAEKRGGRSGGRGTRSGGRGRGERSRGGGRHGGQGGDDDQEREFLERLDGQVFRDVKEIIVSLGDYVTPPKGNVVLCLARALSIAERARLFSQHFVARAEIVSYNPYLTRGFACFYHGTRLSSSHKFSRRGIKPFKIGTEFSPAKAFYVTNQVEAAFKFPLFNHLGKDPSDTVTIFQFDLNLEIFHGEIPPQNGERTFKVRWFESGVNEEAWETFCNHNMYSEHPRPGYDFDIVIGAMCLPNSAAKRVVPRGQKELFLVVKQIYCKLHFAQRLRENGWGCVSSESILKVGWVLKDPDSTILGSH